MGECSARYAQENGTWFLKLSGDLRHTLGPALNALLNQAFAAPDTARFLVDLSDAETIDSTCLGILARISNWSGDRTAIRPIIITSNEDITETLLAVCFDRLFDLRGESTVDAGTLSEITPQDAEAEQLSDLVLEAHRRLCAIDQQNQTVFRNVVETMERETLGMSKSSNRS